MSSAMNMASMSIPQEFLKGFCAPVIGIVGTYPFHKVVFMQQLYGDDRLKAIETVRKQGAWNLYRGVLPPIVGKAASYALLFGIEDSVSRKLTPQFSSFTAHSIGGLFAGNLKSYNKFL